MQRVLRLNVLARNQAIKRERREKEKALKEAARKIRHEKVLHARSQRSIVKAERLNRREDWLLGPLAPNRLAGKDGGGYGMLDFQSTQLPTVLKSEREPYFNFAVNDRVVVVAGRERGKIGQINDVNVEKETVELSDINMADVRILPFMREQLSSKAPFRAFPLPIRIQDVRLVVPLRDKATGKIRDTVVDHLRGGLPFVKPGYGHNTPKHTRFIAGLDIPIPWPASDAQKFENKAADTRRIDVDPVTFIPSISQWILPGSAVDELRNKYSKQRYNHTRDYVQEKMKEDAEKQWKNRQRMLLPQQEYWEKKSKQMAIQGQSTVSPETQKLIKETRAANLGRSSKGIVGTAS